MYYKEKLAFFTILHLTYLIACMYLQLQQVSLMYNDFVNFWLSFILYFIGLTTYLFTYKNQATVIFYLFLTCMSLLLLFLNSMFSFNVMTLIPFITGFVGLSLVMSVSLLGEHNMVFYYSKQEIVFLIAIFMLFSGMLVGFFMLFLQVLAQQVIVMLLMLFFIVYLFMNVVHVISKNKIDNLQENLYENRKTEFLYMFKFQELMRNYFTLVLNHLKRDQDVQAFICIKDGTRLILVDEDNLVNLEWITRNFDEIIIKEYEVFVIHEIGYLIVPFVSTEAEQGVLAVLQGDKTIETLHTVIHQYVLMLQSAFAVARLRQHYQSLPSIYLQDFVVAKYYTEVTHIQREVAQYLHDIVLNKMLALKNMIEVGDLANIELKEAVLFEMRTLNSSLMKEIDMLFPFTLKDLSLYECLCELIVRLKQGEDYHRTKPIIQLRMPKTMQVDAYLFYPIYFLIKKLLSNIFVFAEAMMIDVQLCIEQEQIFITISDDGNRKNIEDMLLSNEKDKNGLVFINYEVRELSGKLSLELNTPKGSIITIQLPYKEI